MNKRIRRNQKKYEKRHEENASDKLLHDIRKEVGPISNEAKLEIEVEENFNMASKFQELLFKEAQKRYCDELDVHKEEEDNYKKIKRFDNYEIFADTNAWLAYLKFHEKNENVAMENLRSSIMNDVININKEKNKKKILITKTINNETMGRLNGLDNKSEASEMIKKFEKSIEKKLVYDVRENGPDVKTVSDMYKKIWLNPKNSKTIEKWSKIKTRYANHRGMSSEEWNKKWKTLPEKDKKKGPPKGSDVIILATIYKYKRTHTPTAVIFITHDNDFIFFKDEIENNLGIVLVDIYSLYNHLKDMPGYRYTDQ